VASSLALYNPAGKVGLGQNPFGKDVANMELYRALARHGGYDPFWVVTHGGVGDDQLKQAFDPQGQAGGAIRGAHIFQQDIVAGAGALLRGFPRLTDVAWLRRRVVGDGAYSLLGLIHTLAPPAIRQEIAAHAVAPLQPWDALICTSPSVQKAVGDMFDAYGEHLAQRLGVSPGGVGGGALVRPQLPLVPLGVDAGRFKALADRPDARARRRAAFGLGEDDILVLWVGRLSFFEKAFPQAMLQAAQQAAQSLKAEAAGARVCFVQAGWFPHADNAVQYDAAAKAYAPSVQVEIFDGNDREGLGELWAAADIFISLVDNIQETFGITPVEAMAAGLPVVASDWDGYRYTVRDGEEGFLIPTLGGPADGIGARMAGPHQLLLESYQTYVGAIAQHTAVHVGRAAKALSELIASKDLRRRMGAAGRARVAAMFDWPVVAAGYGALVDELAAIRAAGRAGAAAAGGLDPVRGDPFRDFAHFATEVLADDTPLRLASGASEAALRATQGLELDRTYNGYRANIDECLQAFGLVERGEAATVGEVLARMPPGRRQAMQLGLAWMCKRGLLDWL
jgi:glycosyltransferase involved in cell wall biosynthesis